jgi:hypothetical protein
MVAMKDRCGKTCREAVDEPDHQGREQDQRGGQGPPQALGDLQADDQHLRHTEVIANRKIELFRCERHRGCKRQYGRH